MPALLEHTSANGSLPVPFTSDSGAEAAELARDLWRHHSQLMVLARRYFSDEAECADVIQDTYLAALRNLSRFRAESRLSTWLHRIAVNQCLMRLRSQSRRIVRSFSEDVAAPLSSIPPDPVWSDELRACARELLSRLPENHQSVIRLRYFEGFSTHQTARLLGITGECAKMRLHRARQALQTLILARRGDDL